MTKWALSLASILLLQACSDDIGKAKEILESGFKGKRTTFEYRNLEAFPGGVVCGDVLVDDPMQRSIRYRQFIVWGDHAQYRPSQEDWAIFCSQDPAAALQATFGIGPLDTQAGQLSKVRKDIRALQQPLQQYLEDNYFLPSTGQGLAALVTASKIPPRPGRFRQGGYLAELPTDPWGRPYHYERSRLGGIAHEYRIFTLGADGAAGGDGQDADVGSEHLKYLDYIVP